MSCCGTCWLLGGAWFHCSFEGFWMSSCSLMFPGVRSFLVFSGFGIKPPVSGFQSYSTLAWRLLHPYSTNAKTCTLKEKRFSTVRDTQRGSQSYMEKRRGRKEIEVTRRRRGWIKRGERNLASNQIPMCCPQPGTSREFHRVTQRREREEGDRGDQEENMGCQKARDRSSQWSFP